MEQILCCNQQLIIVTMVTLLQRFGWHLIEQFKGFCCIMCCRDYEGYFCILFSCVKCMSLFLYWERENGCQ